MDKIIIHNARFLTTIGINQEERTTPRELFLDIELFTDIRDAAKKDRIDATVSYTDVHDVVRQRVEGQSWDLIEAVAESVAADVLARFPLQGIFVRVRKPSALAGRGVEYTAVEIIRMMFHTTHLSLGSNLGDRTSFLNQAIEKLRALGTVAGISSFYETEPVDYTDQPWFLNCVVRLEIALTPEELLRETQQIEQQLGRVRDIPKGPRTIDIDVLLYDDRIIETDALAIPHPRMHERRFVLVPLTEIAPEVMHPVLKKNMVDLLEAILDVSVVRKKEHEWNEYNEL